MSSALEISVHEAGLQEFSPSKMVYEAKDLSYGCRWTCRLPLWFLDVAGEYDMTVLAAA